MLSILTKTGPWKIPGVLWRVLRKSGFYCSILEISRKGSLHKGRLLSDDFFELNRGQRRRRKNGFVLECELSIPEFWHPPCVAYPGPLQISIQAGNKRENWKKPPPQTKKECQRGKQNRAVQLLSFLGMSYFIANGGTTLAKEVMSAQHWILRGLFVNKFLTW